MSVERRDRLGWSPFELAQRLVGFAATMACILGCYGASKIGTLGPYRLLPLTALDDAIPFLPWTIWIYGTATYACFAAWMATPSLLAARRLWATCALSAIACAIVFIVFPTTYPRSLFPTPDDGSATALELADLRASDTAANCVPSLHVALAVGIALCASSFPFGPRVRLALRAISIAWCLAVCVATLTTKQHYIIDVPTGALVGAASFALARRWLRDDVAPFWARYGRPLAPASEEARAAVAKLRARVERADWSIDELEWPEGRERPLDPLMERLLSEVVYIEEIARRNFELLRDASGDADLRFLYDRFAEEEARHAVGLRRVMALHGATLLPPGLGNALVLAQQDRLDPRSDADALLVAMSTPVFETFLDAGTIPFLRAHPELAGPLFTSLEERITKDESAHIALNWIVVRDLARRSSFRRGMRMLASPAVFRGILAIPFMSLDVYALAYRLGFDFSSLLAPFRRIYTVHERFPELARFPPWQLYRLFVICGLIATHTVLALHRAGLVMGPLWTTLTALLRRLAAPIVGLRWRDVVSA